MRVFARNTFAAEIDLDVASEFTARNHRQGMPRQRSGARCFALYDKQDTDKITPLAVIIFSTPRTKKKRLEYKWELLRLSFAPDVRVVGGASKLIKFFIDTVRPVNFFTYQDTSGETTNVYSKSRMTLISDAVDKEILVKNGLTSETAQNNYHDWFSMPQAARLGPDALLGTNLGEVRDTTGKRLSNVDLFTSYCDYHIETVPGDRVYDWQNPRYAYYTYKVTEPSTGEYYIGRKSVYTESPVEMVADDFAQDGYMGSGGKLFKEWKRKHKDTLVKNILGIQTSWSESVKAEIEAIGLLYQQDPLCMNKVPGGVGVAGGTARHEYVLRECPLHGNQKHTSHGICVVCSASENTSKKMCETHGMTSHRGDVCLKCESESVYHISECASHGKTPHRNGKCCSCSAGSYAGLCSVHGETLHTSGGTCFKCIAENNRPDITVKTCPIHGETTFTGATCAKCAVSDTYTRGTCEIHGETTLRKGECTACSSYRTYPISVQICKEHGSVKHIQDTCFTCLMENNPEFRSLLSSRKTRSTSDDHFKCPCCGSLLSTTTSEILTKIIPLVEDARLPGSWTEHICMTCKKKRQFREHPDAQAVLPSLNGWESVDPPLLSLRDTRTFTFVCPACGMEKTETFQTRRRRVQRTGSPCSVGCMLK